LSISNLETSSRSPIQKSNDPELPIGIFYDANYSEPWNFNSQKLSTYLNQTLGTYNLTVSILNAIELKSFMELNQFGIIIITMGVAPQTIWNGSDNSFVETWLDNGGIIIWSGCEEFYWIGMDSGENIPVGHIGSNYVLDMNYIKTISNQYVTPTELGIDLINNLLAHTSDVFCSISALIESDIYFEVYAKNGDYADPILFQPKNGNGYFVRIHADWDDSLPILNLSVWIASFIYNRFFKIPVVVEISSINSLSYLISKQICINVTNFSNIFGILLINSTSDGFNSMNESTIIAPFQKKYLNLSISPLSSARFQSYKITINLFSNYTNSKNISKFIQFFSKNLNIKIQSPISVNIIDVNDQMFPGSTYQLTCSIQKDINESIPLSAVLICEGCINEIKKDIILIENQTNLRITFTIQMMTKAGEYDLYLRIYYGEILFTSSSVMIQIQSLFQNPLFLCIIFLIISLIGISMTLYYIKRKKGMDLDLELKKYLELHDMITIREISKDLKKDLLIIQKHLSLCLQRKKIDGYLVFNEKNDSIFVKKPKLEKFVLDIIPQLKTSDIYQIAKLLNISPLEIEIILTNQIKISKT